MRNLQISDMQLFVQNINVTPLNEWLQSKKIMYLSNANTWVKDVSRSAFFMQIFLARKVCCSRLFSHIWILSSKLKRIFIFFITFFCQNLGFSAIIQVFSYWKCAILAVKFKLLKRQIVMKNEFLHKNLTFAPVCIYYFEL